MQPSIKCGRGPRIVARLPAAAQGRSRSVATEEGCRCLWGGDGARLLGWRVVEERIDIPCGMKHANEIDPVIEWQVEDHVAANGLAAQTLE